MNHIYLVRHDVKKNMRRFYQMFVVPGLLDDWSLVRELQLRHIPEYAVHWIFWAFVKNLLLVQTDTILTDSIRIWFNIPTNIKNLIARSPT